MATTNPPQRGDRPLIVPDDACVLALPAGRARVVGRTPNAKVLLRAQDRHLLGSVLDDALTPELAHAVRAALAGESTTAVLADRATYSVSSIVAGPLRLVAFEVDDRNERPSPAAVRNCSEQLARLRSRPTLFASGLDLLLDLFGFEQALLVREAAETVTANANAHDLRAEPEDELPTTVVAEQGAPLVRAAELPAAGGYAQHVLVSDLSRGASPLHIADAPHASPPAAGPFLPSAAFAESLARRGVAAYARVPLLGGERDRDGRELVLHLLARTPRKVGVGTRRAFETVLQSFETALADATRASTPPARTRPSIPAKSSGPPQPAGRDTRSEPSSSPAIAPRPAAPRPVILEEPRVARFDPRADGDDETFESVAPPAPAVVIPVTRTTPASATPATKAPPRIPTPNRATMAFASRFPRAEVSVSPPPPALPQTHPSPLPHARVSPSPVRRDTAVPPSFPSGPPAPTEGNDPEGNADNSERRPVAQASPERRPSVSMVVGPVAGAAAEPGTALILVRDAALRAHAADVVRSAQWTPIVAGDAAQAVDLVEYLAVDVWVVDGTIDDTDRDSVLGALAARVGRLAVLSLTEAGDDPRPWPTAVPVIALAAPWERTAFVAALRRARGSGWSATA
jgi:hypothetical protein